MTDRSSQRVQFLDCQLDIAVDGTVRATVVIARGDMQFTGTAAREDGPDRDAWSAAAATVAALHEAYDQADDTLTLKDVTVFEIDGGSAVASSLRVTEGEKRRRLFGLCRSEEDHGRAGAISVLSATNRYFSSE